MNTRFVHSLLVQEFTPMRPIDDDVNIFYAGHIGNRALFQGDDSQGARSRVDRAREVKRRTIRSQLHALKSAEDKVVAPEWQRAVKKRLLRARRRIIDGNPVLKLFVLTVKFFSVHEEAAPDQSNLTLLGNYRTETRAQVCGFAVTAFVNDVVGLLEGPRSEERRV